MPAYDHASEPRAITGAKAKYRDDSERLLPTNIMKDPRVVKGSTYSAHQKVRQDAQAILSNSMGPGEMGSAAAKIRRAKKKKSIYDYKPKESKGDDLDLAPYLVEQVAPIAVSTVDTQTATFAPRPDSPEYVPMKTGIDMSTQLTNEVFDFDSEVVPLLQVIVGKTMEQALLEVESEAELISLETEYTSLVADKAAEQQRILYVEAKSAKAWMSKKAKLKEEMEFADAQDQVRAKVAAVRMMKEVLPSTRDRIYEEKIKAGEWVIDTINSVFMPWLYSEVTGVIEGKKKGEEVMDGVIRAALSAAVAKEEAAKAAEAARLAKIEEDRLEKLKNRVGKVKINITASTLGLEEDKVVGPLEITGRDTVADLEKKIKAWLTEAEVKFEAPEGGFLQLGYEGKVVGGEVVVMDIPGGELNVM
ncbi:hypothetical protein TrST_g11845 [Triparma strigata]|uniref:Uncharacterized protein n=1 Tax=Triparma strigata TaxID=1606541 RepID=A0A9W7B3U4_9STRA|nr:hypothetical protein TrST_g11845 [Triparma strigata]